MQALPAPQSASELQALGVHAAVSIHPLGSCRVPHKVAAAHIPDPQLPHEVAQPVHDGSNGATGAQSNFGALGVTARLPNWSFSWNVGNVAFGHLTL
jgi:hypothetical protein